MIDSATPQIVVNCRKLYVSWLPADPDAVAALVPPSLYPRPNRQVVLNQHVVDDEVQSSGLGAYNLTFLGVSLCDPPGGVGQAGWWTHCITSSCQLLGRAEARGAPVLTGRTKICEYDSGVVAETEIDGVPVIRTRCRVGDVCNTVSSGHHQYFTRRDGQLVSAVYPYLAEVATPFEVESVEFLEPEHSTYALRPANPLGVASGFYSPRASFAYPGNLAVHTAGTELPDYRSVRMPNAHPPSTLRPPTAVPARR